MNTTSEKANQVRPEFPMIYKKINDIAKDIDCLGKDGKNKQQGWNFRGIDAAYNYLHPILSKHGVFPVPCVLEEKSEEKLSSKGTTLFYRRLNVKYTFYAEDGSSIEATVIGEAMDSGDKASNKAMSIAQKYAFLQIFTIPTEEEKDPDMQSPAIEGGGIVPSTKKSTNSYKKVDPPKKRDIQNLAYTQEDNELKRAFFDLVKKYTQDQAVMKNISHNAQHSKIKIKDLDLFIKSMLEASSERGAA